MKVENQSQKLLGNLGCFFAMLMWSFTFPASEVLLETWGVMALIVIRTMLAVMTLMAIWVWIDGLAKVLSAPWVRGITVGGVGFGIGAVLLLVGQKMSDPVTPAIAAAMMPIAGAAVEVIFDKRRLRLRLIIAIALAKYGYIAQIIVRGLHITAYQIIVVVPGVKINSQVNFTTALVVGSFVYSYLYPFFSCN